MALFDRFRGSLFNSLKADLETYLDKDHIKAIYEAYQLAADAHEGQKRQSGEPYITHPVSVARILASLHLDPQSIMAAILHDVLEDTQTDKATLADRFGEEVADLVDGVSKLTQIQFQTKAEAQAENFRKMVLAMAHDIRVIIVKLSDRLHNMRTLESLSNEKRRRIAQETLDIYAPIANRLGMNAFRVELEDRGFAALYPVRSSVLKRSVRKARGNKRQLLKHIEHGIRDSLKEAGIEAEVVGREKHLFSIYKKMLKKQLPFSEVNDVFAFRIIVDKTDTCYRALGSVHNLYKPVPGRFKDYIAIPKANGYQSLHTVLFGPHGAPIEIQIRTREMHQTAENGIAAHWLYKTNTSEKEPDRAHLRARGWVKGLIEMQENAGNPLEFIENVKIDLFPDEVYVFTPTGNIMELPAGATAVDFAYAVHTDVGNSCIAAKIDRHLAPLSTRLRNGQTLEIVTAPGARPNPAWLNFVVTGKARSNIRHFLKSQQRSESISLGRRLLEKALTNHSLVLDQIEPEVIQDMLTIFKFKTLDILLQEIGLGNRSALLVARDLAGRVASEQSDALLEEGQTPLVIRGTEGMVLTYAKCCRPIPGDPILGFLSAGKGILIHAETCPKISQDKLDREKVIHVQWEEGVQGTFEVELKVQLANERGALAQLAIAFSEAESNIDNISTESRDCQQSTFNILINVKNRRHLASILRRVRKVKPVIRIIRSR